MSGLFDGRSVLVTGGAGGIGAEIAHSLSQEGATVVILDVDERGEEIAREIGGRFIAADLASPAEAATAVADAIEDLDGLVNAAGVSERERFPRLDVEAWDRVLRINAAAPLMLIQALLSRFREGASIVNITSLEEEIPVGMLGPMTPIYAASKGALGLLTRALAPALGERGIRVNAVAPGLVHTPLLAPLRERCEPWSAAQTPLRRWAKPDDIADAVLFLLSEDARNMTGASLRVDGGFALGPQRGLEP